MTALAGYVNWKPYFWFVYVSWPVFTGGGSVAVKVGTGVDVSEAAAGIGVVVSVDTEMAVASGVAVIGGVNETGAPLRTMPGATHNA